MTARHLKLVADESSDGMTTSAGDDPVSAAQNSPLRGRGPFVDPVTDVSVRMMTEALDAVETAMFGRPIRRAAGTWK